MRKEEPWLIDCWDAVGEFTCIGGGRVTKRMFGLPEPEASIRPPVLDRELDEFDWEILATSSMSKNVEIVSRFASGFVRYR